MCCSWKYLCDLLVHTISFQTFLVLARETLVPFEVIFSGCNALVVPFQQLLKGPMAVLLCERVNDLCHSLFHLLNCLITTASELREQGLDYREAEELSWCPSWSNSLWQRWSCGLVHCPGGNATDPIWRVLASSDGISSSSPLKPHIVTLTLWPINSGVLTFLLLLHLSSSLTDTLPSLNLLCHSKTHARFMQDGWKAVWSIPYISVAFFPSLKQNFIILLSFF